MNAFAETDSHKVARLVEDGWPAAKILSALGYPGYGCRFAVSVLKLVLDGVAPAHAIERTYHADREAERLSGAVREFGATL